jgi:putative ABC transport system substrate-binding protein
MASRRTFLVTAAALLLAPGRSRGQAPAPTRICILSFGPTPDPGGAPPEPIVRYLAALGYVAGKNVVYEPRYANGSPEAYGQLAARLRDLSPAVLFVSGSGIGSVVSTLSPIPVVFAVSDDPVAEGVVRTLARPGGSATGVTHMSPDLAGKRLEILRMALPDVRRVAVLYEPDQKVEYVATLESAALRDGLVLLRAPLRSIEDLAPSFAAMKREGAQAMFVEPNRYSLAYAKRIAALAIEHRTPTISAYDTFVRSGGLMTYGATADDMLARAAAQIDKIVRGARPAEIPVEQPARFALIVNSRTAAELGISLPKELLLRADEVIR